MPQSKPPGLTEQFRQERIRLGAFTIALKDLPRIFAQASKQPDEIKHGFGVYHGGGKPDEPEAA